jgi:hypothetical protein|tara:strand:- start:4116 stop:4511 length:396 start_codon:yes stop_codon:yes gene_type:complete
MVIPEVEALIERGTRKTKRGLFTIQTSEGTDEVLGIKIGALGICKRDEDFKVYHLPSGLNVATRTFGFGCTLSSKRFTMCVQQISNWNTKKLAALKSKEFIVFLLRDYCMERSIAESSITYLKKKAPEYAS